MRASVRATVTTSSPEGLRRGSRWVLFGGLVQSYFSSNEISLSVLPFEKYETRKRAVSLAFSHGQRSTPFCGDEGFGDGNEPKHTDEQQTPHR